MTARTAAAAVVVLVLPQVPRRGFREPSAAARLWGNFGETTFPEDVFYPAAGRGGPGQKRKDITEVLQLLRKLAKVVIIVEL